MKTLKEPIVLASQSPRRKALLELIGITPTVVPSHVEEHTDATRPEAVVMDLSRQKAEAVAAQYKDKPVIIIGADTIVWFNDKILGKPKDEQDAVCMISAYAGHTHEVYTGVTLIRTGDKPKRTTFYDRSLVTVYPMTQDEIADYVATGEPFDKAGGYGIQGLFARYIKAIDGDYHNIVGLPVGKLWQVLKSF